MPKQAVKIRFEDVEAAASDGYYVFLTLLGAVATTTLAIILSLSLEMLG
ncbi:hypothetical protein [Hyphomicrobium sp. 99]|nr:hypothetical protein [Hyphomicrobium sp. 99]